jgi:hypothetical protein
MKHFLYLSIVICHVTFSGQVTYFNAAFNPPAPEIGSGYSTNLLVLNDSLVTLGFYPNVTENVALLRTIDANGIEIGTSPFGVGEEIMTPQMSESINKNECGYLWSSAEGSSGAYPRCILLTEDFEEIWRYNKVSLLTDTSSAEFSQNIEALDGKLIVSGVVSYNPSAWIFGDEYANVIVAKLDALGNEIWFKEIDLSLYNLEVSSAQMQAFMRSGLIELSDQNLLLWGTVGLPIQPTCIKIDSVGNYVDGITWGNNTLDDGDPWPVQISETEFMFAYSHATSNTNDIIYTKPRMGILNSETMEVNLFPLFDHAYYNSYVTDFEKTPDGGYVLLGYGFDGATMGFAYMLKADSNGNEEWFNTYVPTFGYSSPNAYDLEITSDGGLAFVGNFHESFGNYNKSWVVKTDACGDAVFNGCPLGIEQTQQYAFSVYPNPSSELIQIKSNEVFQHVAIRDITGKIVLQKHERSNYSLLNVADLSEGVYLLETDFGNGKLNAQRMVVVR